MATIGELFEAAMGCQRSGNPKRAESLCRQVLQADPTHAAAHHLLGLLAASTGRQETAVALLRKAIALNPGDADCHFNLGIVFTQQSRPEEAIECFRQTLRRNPHHAHAHNNLGNALKNQGKLAEAALCYREALRCEPRSAFAYFNLGIVLKDQGLLADASLCFRQAVANNPYDADAHVFLGNALQEQDKLSEAIECYRQALRANPQHADAHNNLGVALKKQGQPAAAAQCYQQALRINPQHADACNNLGNAFKEQKQPAEAIACYRQALQINPQFADAYNNLGSALYDQGEIATATECFLHALEINPDYADAHLNLGNALSRVGLHQDAVAHNAHGLRINPTHPPALWQRALLRLLEGDFEGGWQDYEQRWALPESDQRALQQPRWDGSSLGDKTILVFAEQGLGDTIQFARYLPMVKERGGTVLFECQRALAGVLAGVRGIDQLIAHGAPLPPYQIQVPLLSLPRLSGTTLATIPATVPYLRADPKRVEHWKKELLPLDGFKIGIAWQGNPKNTGDRYRSLPLVHFEALARQEGVRLLSLQVGHGTEQMAAAPFPVTDLGSRFDPSSLDDLAAVLLNLDLVVTVETAVAHLAGALAVPVWVALPVAAAPDWRWLRGRTDSPWYPTMRLFRQNRFGDWNEVFERIQKEFKTWRR